jgi:hypothetical protein
MDWIPIGLIAVITVCLAGASVLAARIVLIWHLKGK